MTPTRRDFARLVGAAGIAAGTPAFAQQAQVPSAQPAADADDSPTKVGAGRDDATRLVAPVSINNQGPFQFLVDTGANRSCISRELAEQLALAPGPEVSLHTVVSERRRPSVVVDRLQLGAKAQRNVTVPVLPMPGADTVGVLGVDWLKNRRLVLDFKNGSLEVTAPKLERSTDKSVVVPAKRKSGQLTMVDADVGGRPISAMIDSGSELSIGNDALRRLMPANAANGPHAVRIQMSSLTGEKFSGDLLYIPFMRLGGLTLGNAPVVFTETHVFKLWGLEDKPAIILGMDLLTQFTVVALDFGRSTVRFDIA